MSFPPEVPFNPKVNKVPILNESSGNPKSFQDPKSVASIGAKIQAMSDQAQADTLYDAKPEGFRGGRFRFGTGSGGGIAALTILGMILIFGSYFK